MATLKEKLAKVISNDIKDVGRPIFEKVKTVVEETIPDKEQKYIFIRAYVMSCLPLVKDNKILLKEIELLNKALKGLEDGCETLKDYPESLSLYKYALNLFKKKPGSDTPK